MNVKAVDFPLSIIREFLKRGALIELSSGDFWIGFGEGALQAFYVPEFFPRNSSAWMPLSASATVSRESLRSSLESLLQSEELRPTWSPHWQEPRPEPFFEELEDLKSRFQRGTLQKAVPVVFAESSGAPGPADRARLLLSLLERSGRSRIYGQWDESSGILGATPEVLFEVAPDGALSTMALAGTAPKREGRAYLLQSEKDLREHRWVVDDIREKLAPFGDVSVGTTDVLELPTIFHLHTPIRLEPSAEYEGRRLEDWVATLHPTAALGGYPSKEAMEWLRASDSRASEKRRRFGAPFGAGQADRSQICLVAIRNIQWEGGRTWLGSGCGVVDGSDPEREWQELVHKRASVLRMLGLEKESAS